MTDPDRTKKEAVVLLADLLVCLIKQAELPGMLGLARHIARTYDQALKEDERKRVYKPMELRKRGKTQE